MSRYFAFCLAVIISSACLFAQETKNPVSSVIKEILPRQQKNIIAAVESMPADKFNYKPTPDQMTFGHLVVHIVESNNYLCGKAADTAAPKVQEVKESDSKEKLVAALKASFDFCSSALAKADDSKLGDNIEVFGGRQAPRAFAFIALASGWADHYSAAAQYLRLNGILPPTAKKKSEAEGKPEQKK
jgi:DinB superfamily